MQLPTEINISKFKTQPVSENLKNQCKQKLAALYQIFRKNNIHMKMPSISFDLRGKTAGQAYLQKHHVQFNAILLNENPKAFLDEIIGHELAHLAAFQGFKETGHGARWKQCMAMIGLEPKRCHNLDTSNSTVVKVYKAICNCPNGHKISSRRLLALLTGTLRCKTCKTILLAQDPVLRQKAAKLQTAQPAQTQKPTLTPTKLTTTTPLPPPTTRQLGYMKYLSKRHAKTIPPEALLTSASASAWIQSVLNSQQS
jgi:SprT protein